MPSLFTNLPDLGGWDPSPLAEVEAAPSPEPGPDPSPDPQGIMEEILPEVAPPQPDPSEPPEVTIALEDPRPSTISDFIRDPLVPPEEPPQRGGFIQQSHPRLKLGAVRRGYGVTLRTITHEIGISQQTYTYIERGKTNPNFAAICKLARFFQMSLDDLFGDLAERLAPGYAEAVARGRAEQPLPAYQEPPRAAPHEDYEMVPRERLVPPSLPRSARTPIAAPAAPPTPAAPPEPPPMPEFLQSIVQDFDTSSNESPFIDPMREDS